MTTGTMSNAPFAPASPVRGGALAASVASDFVRPTFSVITVVYNALDALCVTVDSVQAQTFGDVEHIVVDGGSCDGTLAFLQGLGNRISLWVSGPDTGIYDAMNKGLKLARGEYVYFLNAGDTFVSGDTLRAVDALLVGGPTILMNRVRAISAAGLRIFPKTMGLTRARETFLSAYCHQAAFVRRDAYLAIGGFDLTYLHFADFKALWTIRSGDCKLRETQLEVAEFPLDGVSSDWSRATELTQERERLLAELGDPAGALTLQLRVLRARFYTLRMMIRHHLWQCI